MDKAGFYGGDAEAWGRLARLAEVSHLMGHGLHGHYRDGAHGIGCMWHQRPLVLQERLCAGRAVSLGSWMRFDALLLTPRTCPCFRPLQFVRLRIQAEIIMMHQWGPSTVMQTCMHVWRLLADTCSGHLWHAQGTLWQRACASVRETAQLPFVRALMQLGQVVASLAFVVLYVWSTYSTPVPGSLRHSADILLCGVFAAEFVARLLVGTCVPSPICMMCLVHVLSHA